MIAVAVLPLMQVSACATGLGQVLGSVGNALPSITYNSLQSVFLLPVELVLELLTGETNNGSGTGGIGNSSGLGSTSNLGTTSGL